MSNEANTTKSLRSRVKKTRHHNSLMSNWSKLRVEATPVSSTITTT